MVITAIFSKKFFRKNLHDIHDIMTPASGLASKHVMKMCHENLIFMTRLANPSGLTCKM